jgi:hypothetical protein
VKETIFAAENNLPPPSLEELVKRKLGSGVKPQITEDEIVRLLESCTLNKKQRKKLWYKVACKGGLFDFHRRTIKKRLRESGVKRAK